MLIPVRCTGCGKVLADKYEYFLREVRKRKIANSPNANPDRVVYFNQNNATKSEEGLVLDQLGLVKPCCRSRMITHVDIE